MKSETTWRSTRERSKLTEDSKLWSQVLFQTAKTNVYLQLSIRRLHREDKLVRNKKHLAGVHLERITLQWETQVN